jgi:hypothetical protein
VRILNASRSLGEIEVHLTEAEARKVIAELADLLDDLTRFGMSESHTHISTGEAEIALYAYTTNEELEAEVADRMSDNS